jgi:glycosyltransferase involved in cell wall biosynthesis
MDMLWTLWKRRGEFRVAVVHVYSGKAYLWAMASTLLAKMLGKRVVLWLHGGSLPEYSRSHPYLISVAFKRADRVVSPSRYLQQAFLDRYPVDIIPYELPIHSYPYRQRARVKARLLWLRAFSSGYNPTMAVRVVKLLAAESHDVHLTMCGPDNGDGSFQETQHLAEELGVADRLDMPGKVSKERIKSLGQGCDIFLNTTHYDNTPVSVIEAMAMGMCVVSTDVGGMSYLVSNQEDGLLVPSDDAKAMALACRSLLTKDDLGMRLSAKARERALDFDDATVIRQWKDLIERLHREPECQGN